MIKRPVAPRLILLLCGLVPAVFALYHFYYAAQPVQAQTFTVGFTTSTYSVNEASEEATINISINSLPASGQTIVVRYSTTPGSATAGTDYVSVADTKTFTSTSSAIQSFTIDIINDTVREDNETVLLTLRLQSVTPSDLDVELGTSAAILTIIDNDGVATGTPTPSVLVDDAEPNDTFDDSFTIAAEAAARCQLTLWPPGDVDFYRFSVKAGSFYRVLTDNLLPGLDTMLEVYNTTGGKVAENDDVGGPENVGDRRSEVAIRADANGFYYARVVNKDATDPAGLTYCVQVDEISQPTPTATPTFIPTRQGSDTCEPNGRLDLACLIGENQIGQFNFIPPFNEGPDNDYYKLWVRPGITYTCETTELSDVADTNIIFLDNNGNDFNPQLGNNDKEINDRGSRLTYFSTYTGYLHILVGPVNPVPLDEAARHTYSLSCVSEVAPTATPTLAPRTPVPLPPGGGGTFPTATPQASPLPSPTPFDFSFLTPSPVVIPVVTIQPLPTATPFSGGQQTATVNVTVYYDSNFNFMPEPAEGIMQVAVFLYDNATGRLIAFGYTNSEGVASFMSIATTGAVRVEVPFLNFRQIVGAGESNILLRVAPQPLPIGIP
jgi:hypothetical protein